ncbi:MAG: hypothetical protein ACWA5T_05695 [Parvularcula sp.]
MKSNVPWSVKGIDPEARVVAKAAARKAGMTLGEWMNSMIREAGNEERPADAPTPLHDKGTGVTPDQLRAVVDSLNRLNERLRATEDNLKKTEEKSREAMGGLNQGLETVFERIKRVEKARAETQAAIQGSVPQATPEGRERLESLRALERALSQMLEQFEAQRHDTVARVEQNEHAVASLTRRVDLMDERLTAGFQEVHDALDVVGAQLDQTERTAKAVMLEAKEASSSTDAEYVERTGKKLQLLGNEIKRSGDQISAVEQMVASLSKKIEAAERRSADGISDVAKDIAALREDLAAELGADKEINPALLEATAAAEETVSSLQKSYDDMVARLEGRLKGDLKDAAPTAGTPGEIPDPDIAPPSDSSPQESLLAAMSTLQPAEDPRAGEPVPDLTADSLAATGNDIDPDAEFDAVFGDGPAPSDTDTVPPASEEAGNLQPTGPLTAKQKILAAARARKERVELEKAAEETAAGATVADAVAGPNADQSPGETSEETLAAAKKADDGQNRRLGLPLLVLMGLCVLGAAGAAAWFFRGDSGAPKTPPQAEATNPQLTENTRTEPEEAPLPTPTAPLDPTPDAPALYAEAKALMSTGDAADSARAFPIMREAAINGNVPAQYRLGEMYFKGRGTAQDLREAKRWFESAALSGNAAAMHRLGSLAVQPPNGEPANYDQALDWFARAANYGVVDSMYNLGFLYDPSSDILPADMRDAARAYRYYMLAAHQGDEQAQLDGVVVASTLSPDTVESIDAEIDQWTPLPNDPRVNDGLDIAN